jgi:hypothetical protein
MADPRTDLSDKALGVIAALQAHNQAGTLGQLATFVSLMRLASLVRQLRRVERMIMQLEEAAAEEIAAVAARAAILADAGPVVVDFKRRHSATSGGYVGGPAA